MILKKWALALVLVAALSMGVYAAGETEASAAELPTLKFLTQNFTFDLASEATATLLEELTGYQVEYFTLPADNPQQKLLLELSSGVDYDYLRLGFGDYVVLGGKNVPLPLDDLISQHGPNITPLLKTGPNNWRAVTIDGKIMGVPGIVPRSDHGVGIAVNSAYLDKLGMELPETLEEFETLARAMKDELGVVPLTGNGWMLPIVASAFGVNSLRFSATDGDIESVVRQEGLLDYIKYMAYLYEEGLIDPEWPVNKGANVKEKFVNGQAGMRYTGWWELPGVQDALASNFPGAEIKFIRPLIGADGSQMINVPSGLQNVGVIPRTAANPEDTMKWLNAIYEPSAFIQIVLGTEGVHYEIRDDGEYWPIQPIFAEEKNNAYAFYTSPPGLNFGKLWQARVKKNDILYAAFLELDKVPDSAKVVDPTAFAGNLEAVATYTQATTEHFNNWAIKVIAGAESIDTYDNIISEWEKLGGAEMETEVKAWWADFN